VTTRSPGPLPAGQPRAAIVAEVAAALADLARDTTVLVACSGGPDSTALAFLVAEARPDLELVLAHVRHGLRDDAADLAAVEQHAAWLGCRLVVAGVAVTPGDAGPEAAARDARYAALRELAREAGAAALLLGHTADDQAETLLLRLARGTGPTGLRGMAPRDGDRWRPLLRLRRRDVHGFLACEGIPHAEDPTNADVAQPRARVRHDLLPALRGVGPDPVGALARLADLARSDEAALAAWALDEARRHVRRVGRIRVVPLAALRALPAAITHRVVRHLVVEVGGGYPPTAAALARVLALAPGQRTDLPHDVVAGVGGGWLAVSPGELQRHAPASLVAGGRVEWPAAGIALAAVGPEPAEPAAPEPAVPAGPEPAEPAGPERIVSEPAGSEPMASGRLGPDPTGSEPMASGRSGGGSDGGAVDDVAAEQVAFALPGAWEPPSRRPPARLAPPGGAVERLTIVLPERREPLTVRHRAAGDRICTPGGTKRLAALFVDLGVPRAVRDVWPVVATGDRVVWVPGLAADRDVLSAGRAAPGLLLAVEPGGPRGGRGRR
jgi:tRNA(Ile)-lysidine synthase